MSKTASQIKRDAHIKVWVELILRVSPDHNPQLKLADPLIVRTGTPFRAEMLPQLRANRLLTISYGEQLYVLDDPMEILLVLEARAGYRALRKRLSEETVGQISQPLRPNG